MAHLTEEEKTEQLKTLCKTKPVVKAAWCQLERILASERFQRCQLNSRGFLEYVVKMSLIGQTEHIMERSIALDVFPARVSRNVGTHGVVRECARQLRRRLREYYRHEGRRDPIRISIPNGKYVPEIRDQRQVIAVGPFENWKASPEQAHLAKAVTDEVVQCLSRDHRFLVRKVSSLSEHATNCGLRGAFVCMSEGQVEFCYCLVHYRRGDAAMTRLSGHRHELLKLATQAADSVLLELRGSVSTAKKPKPQKDTQRLPAKPAAHPLRRRTADVA